MTTQCALLLLTLLAIDLSAGPTQWDGWRNSLRPPGEPAGELVLATDGETDYAIVTPAEATPQEQKAAEELAHWLGEMTGTEFPIVSDTEPAREREMSVGGTSRLAAANPPIGASDLGDEGYAIAVRGERLFLLGGHKRGPINAVFAFLEEDLGLRWYTTEVDRIPREPTVEVRPVPRTYAPPLQIRDPFYRDAFNGTWSLRNRTNAPSASIPEEWGGNMDYALFVHTYNTLVPPGKYFGDHPEYYMQNEDGKRIRRQLCHTNPEVVRIATDRCLEILRERPHCEIISVSKNDGGGSCVCEGCRAIDEAEGSDAGSLLHFVNQVAAGIEREFPEVIVSTLAYLETFKPPATIRPRKNVAIRLCTDRCMWSHPFTPARESPVFSPAMEGWAAIHDNIHIWDYCVNFSHYTAPMPNMQVMLDNVRYFVANNARGVMLQAGYQSPGGERALMRSWVFAKLLWDPSRDLHELMQDFIWGYYGKAAPAIAAYNKLLEQTGAEHQESMASPKGGIRYPMDSEFLSTEFLAQATQLLDEAGKLAGSEDVLQRVELARVPIMYVKLCRGPEFVGEGYTALLDRFEAVARRAGITHIKEGPPDVERKLKKWRDDLRVYEGLQEIPENEVKIRPLPNVWKFATDARDVGLDEGWFAAGFDDSAWAEVRSDQGEGWENQGFADYTGLGWYRQSFDVPAEPGGKRLYLYFSAVDEDAWVYINGKLAFHHTCKSTGLPPEVIWVTPFAFDAAPHLKPGQVNTIAVRVLNRMGMGGIYKPVHLVASDRELDAALIGAVLERRLSPVPTR